MSRKRRRRSFVRNPLCPLEQRFPSKGSILDDMLDIFEVDDETTEPYPERGDFWTLAVRKELER